MRYDDHSKGEQQHGGVWIEHPSGGGATSAQLNLRPGRGAGPPLDEIMATLDQHGALDGLPFMPEMTPYCGKTFTVWRRADKVCDTIVGPYMRQMFDTVHLAEAL